MSSNSVAASLARRGGVAAISERHVHGGNVVRVDSLGERVQPAPVPADSRQRFEPVRREGRAIDQVLERLEVHHAGHRKVEAALLVQAAERDLVESVNVDDQVERLPDRQEVTQHQ